MANEIVERKRSEFAEGFKAELDNISTALPKDLNIEKFVVNCEHLLSGKQGENIKEYAKKYGMAPVRRGMVQGAILGLDAMNKEFYLVPYGSDLQFMQGYVGRRKLVMKYSVEPVENIFAEVIRQGDTFNRWSEDGVWHYKHVQNGFDGVIVGAFCVCKFANGSILLETMSLADLEKVRKSSKSPNSPAWNNFKEEMYKKTVMNRLTKRISLDFDNPAQRDLYDEDGSINVEKEQIETHDIYEDSDVVETEVIEPKSVEPDVIDYNDIEASMPDFLKGGD